MKILLLEFRLLREDLLKVFLLSFSIPVLNVSLFLGSGGISSESTTSNVLSLLFGSVNNFQMNWVYWCFLCYGYFLLLQIAWKSNVHMYEIYQVIRYRNVSLYWRIKCIVGFLITVFYVLCCLAVTFIASLLLHAQAVWDFSYFIFLIILTLNLYIHALTWLAIKIYSLVEAALIIVGLLFYAGVRIVEPYIPLYYAMTDHVRPYLLPTILVELLVIYMLMALIKRKVKNRDIL